MEEIHFLGHIVSKDGVRMDPTKIEAIQSWPDLKTVHDELLRALLILQFSEIAAPLDNLTQKGVKFRWDIKEKQGFHHLKEELSSQPVLILQDLRKPFVVQCDACGHNIGAVLMQEGHGVAYESRILFNAEKTL